ncbi:MAG: YIP1 family protein [Alphaproteobacteria bacterium]|nr:YIP1 family protein [Alphaproteobacteria bacterium]MBU1513884.1 YIP1 family protein [Alphaproteobacteria bacterium]MBU2094471.1 YIP1 family protein [Alphaproteobacteria bacterium]MBU2149803.1 YIP1 family protein [Alphaproteobacteria bacterium]MBU2307274.1 YIP1 family protein [Alphaproteobacteria bacterium]
MSVIEPGSATAGLVARVKGLLLKPTETWDEIDREPATIAGLYKSYIIPLAAIPAVCSLVGLLIFGIGGFGISFRPSPIWLVVQAIVSYGLSLAMVYVMALIIEALAPNFGGAKDRVQAFKVAAYAPTASWVAGVFMLIPALGIIAILGGLYSLFLFFKGLPKLMKTPEEKALPYTAVVIVVAIVVSIVIGLVTSSVMTLSGAMNPAAAIGSVSGTVNVPGAGSVDLAKLQEASKRMEVAAKQAEAGTATATDPEALKAYLPASVAGFNRDEVSASSGGAGGYQGSTAEGRYAKGDASLRLEVTDMGAAGALAGMASAFNVKSSKETATGYEKVGMVGGRMTQENYDRQAKSGEYSVLVGERFMVQASGNGVTMEELKAAVGAVDQRRLEGLAKAG